METKGKPKVTVMYKAKSKRECFRALYLLDMVSRNPDEWEIHYGRNGRVQSMELAYLV